ncbi:IclR family transcriptional regulator [Subtercola frigoramans]|uniref:DNA-binding IclR family transcriptional regulator n=1 Tax=Subtercola frigoramans TaxID=120298 RepID=A0ABS2L951_9MICO|nr:IclR family transcriptional regulator [Subtercola frigoramans]MBM7473623.1 DNA-binding IclR family transcriptional regulator [Subtercola frigoramans]
MRSTQQNESGSVIGRVSAILDCFAGIDTVLSVSELSRRSGISKTTTWRITGELVERGFLEQQPGGLVLGLRFFELGESAMRPRTLRRLALARMEVLRHVSGNTVHLAVITEADVVYIEILPVRSSPRMPSRVGGRVPAHATAVGKALLAFSPVELVDAVIARGLDAVGPRTITDAGDFRDELDRVRGNGVAQETEESAPGVSCVAVPVFFDDGPVAAALSISGPSQTLRVDEVTILLRDAAAALQRDAQRLPKLGRQF